ncbi:MAG: hypothetical protein GY851_16555, partial [bacterium]|nr:hypothetical protein [bacterium]
MDSLPLFDLNGEYGRGTFLPEFAEVHDLLAHLDYLGIERTLVTHTESRDLNPVWGNRHLLAELADNVDASGRLVPMLTINPPTYYEKGGMDSLRSAFEQENVRAWTFFRKSCRHAILHVEPILTAMAEYRPVVVWNTRDTNGDGDYRDLIELAERLPQVQFICTRKMWGGFSNVLDAMWRCTNIHTDISWVHMRRNIE